jgi:hypothetical protein
MLGTTKGLIKSRQVTKLVTVGLNLVKQYWQEFNLNLKYKKHGHVCL